MFRGIFQRSAWHYTTVRDFRKIAESRVLLPATAGVPAGEEPVIWFSVNPDWEQSACKMKMSPEGRQSLTKDQTRVFCRGLVRLGYPKRHLVPWPAIATKASMSEESRIALEKAGRIMGADPGEWLGHLEPIPLRLLTVEIERDGIWVSVENPDQGFGVSSDFESGRANASDWRILGMPPEFAEDRIAIFIDVGSMFQDGPILQFRLRHVRLEDITSRLPTVGTPDADLFSEAIAARNRPDYWTASQECAEPGLSEEGQRNARSWFILLETGANYFSYSPVSQYSMEVDCATHLVRMTSLTEFGRDGSVEKSSDSITSDFSPITPGGMLDNARRRYCKCADPDMPTSKAAPP